MRTSEKERVLRRQRRQCRLRMPLDRTARPKVHPLWFAQAGGGNVVHVGGSRLATREHKHGGSIGGLGRAAAQAARDAPARRSGRAHRTGRRRPGAARPLLRHASNRARRRRLPASRRPSPTCRRPSRSRRRRTKPSPAAAKSTALPATVRAPATAPTHRRRRSRRAPAGRSRRRAQDPRGKRRAAASRRGAATRLATTPLRSGCKPGNQGSRCSWGCTSVETPAVQRGSRRGRASSSSVGGCSRRWRTRRRSRAKLKDQGIPAVPGNAAWWRGPFRRPGRSRSRLQTQAQGRSGVGGVIVQRK